MCTAIDFGPWPSRSVRRRRAMSPSASSQLTRSNSPGPPTRFIGWRIRSGSFCTSAMATPLVQQKPLECGLSLSARSETSLPSSTVATMPHSGSQMRQNVAFSSVILLFLPSALSVLAGDGRALGGHELLVLDQYDAPAGLPRRVRHLGEVQRVGEAAEAVAVERPQAVEHVLAGRLVGQVLRSVLE